ncbi:beta-propeller domain-containing protein [Tessaracoccus flavescens]|nr:beta-propeller domain-containing protein [Tessaracoccus flavescens]
MNDKILRDMAEQFRPDPSVRADLLARIAAEPAGAPETPRPQASPSRPRRRRVAWIASAAAVAVVAGLAAMPSLIGGSQDHSDPPAAPTAEAAPGDYSHVYDAVRNVLKEHPQADMGFQFQWGTDRRPEGSAADTSAPAADGAGQYATNVQVAGIDEGDIVKSDGRTIFAASGDDVVLLAAQGADTHELARIDTSTTAGREGGTAQGPVVDLMLHGSSLVVLVTEYEPRLSELPASQESAYVPYDATQTKALIYDVSDPAAPTLSQSLGQSGAFSTSRLSGDLLYLVTQHAVTDPHAIDPAVPGTFVPSTTDDGTSTPLPADDLVLMPRPDGPRYSVVSSIDLATNERVDTLSVLGGSQTTYMSEESLYLASVEYAGDADGDQARDETGMRSVTEQTKLARIALDDGRLTAAAEGTVPGVLLNQFAMDDYEGRLRLAVTLNGVSTSGQWESTPSLLVLDGNLEVISSIPKLATNETVQSVRFVGPVAYVVSFRQIDPLFAIDLSDPAAPKVMGELKIPGFSTYLHPWADGQLLGLGMDATDDGMVTGLKLSMFDTSDPFALKEQAVLKVPYADSEALRNHKAVLVDSEHSLIGFPALNYSGGGSTADYVVYRFEDGAFRLAGKLPVEASEQQWVSSVRGLTIGDSLYVVTERGVDVYGADSLEKVASEELG